MQSISLKELTDQIEQVLHRNFALPVWVHAEISELRENRGHCYLELIEKDGESDNLLAKSRATIWANTYRMLKPYFESKTGETLRSGLKVLLSVVVEFNGVYGFNLNVRDIDPVFTVGDLAIRRLEVIRQLESDGVVDMNKILDLPTLPQRIAVISSATAAGYDDFCNQLDSNSQNYVFYHKLFPAIMQGVNTEASIISALEKIYQHIDLFDLVVIIRGGGATTDLSAFDSYNLALNCAQFPLPIISGIGHHRDNSILDMVAHTQVKTPTAAAEFLILKMDEAESLLFDLAQQMNSSISDYLYEKERELNAIQEKIKFASKKSVLALNNGLNKKVFLLKHLYTKFIHTEQSKLEKLSHSLENTSPQYLFERGYTITTKNGKRVTSKSELKKDDIIQSHFVDGSVESKLI